MPTILLLHHVQGLTSGVVAIADTLRAAGHSVHTPDLLDGRQFASIPDGMAYVQALGFPTVIARGAAAAEPLPADIVYLGMSMGVLPAQALAQTRPGARAAIFLHGAVPVSEFSPLGPPTFRCRSTPWMAIPNSSIAAISMPPGRWWPRPRMATMFLYPGKGHLFTDNIAGRLRRGCRRAGDAAGAGVSGAGLVSAHASTITEPPSMSPRTLPWVERHGCPIAGSFRRGRNPCPWLAAISGVGVSAAWIQLRRNDGVASCPSHTQYHFPPSKSCRIPLHHPE